MTITAERKTQLIQDYRFNESDSGSPQIQVAILTDRIVSLTEHLRTHKHDYASRRGLLMLVSRRTRLLKYLSRTRHDAYKQLIASLGLRK